MKSRFLEIYCHVWVLNQDLNSASVSCVLASPAILIVLFAKGICECWGSLIRPVFRSHGTLESFFQAIFDPLKEPTWTTTFRPLLEQVDARLGCLEDFAAVQSVEAFFPNTSVLWSPIDVERSMQESLYHVYIYNSFIICACCILVVSSTSSIYYIRGKFENVSDLSAWHLKSDPLQALLHRFTRQAGTFKIQDPLSIIWGNEELPGQNPSAFALRSAGQHSMPHQERTRWTSNDTRRYGNWLSMWRCTHSLTYKASILERIVACTHFSAPMIADYKLPKQRVEKLDLYWS